jgi:hypothetical protein
MLRIIRSKETNQIAVVTESKRNKWDNLNNKKREVNRNFRNKKTEYPKNKINELATNSTKKKIRDLYRGINAFKRAYQPRGNLVNDGNGDLLADSPDIKNRWKNYFFHLLDVHKVNDVRQIEMLHTA